MKAVLALDAIGDNVDRMFRDSCKAMNGMISGLGDAVIGKPPASYWVAEITGPDLQYKWKREFLRGKKDYSKANSVGSRGVFIYYTMESGHVYEVKERTSWKRGDRYFCRISDDGEIIRIDESEVTLCLAENALSGLTF
jgi:hypothetical protein